jgi:hypothetical protein
MRAGAANPNVYKDSVLLCNFATVLRAQVPSCASPPQTPNHMHKRLHYPAYLSRLESTVAQDSNVAGLARIHWSCIYESDLKTNTDAVQAP